MFRVGQEEIDAVSRVLESGSLFRIGSKYHEVDLFEKELAEKIGTEYCLCLANGTGALTAALAALEIGPGDEVIVPGYTFIATAVAVLSVGAIPVICDINETLTMDPEDVLRRITPRTKAIIPVHIQGFPSDMGRLCEIAREHNLKIVEDACQSDGGSFHGQRLGTFGDLGAFSFNYFKIIAAGEGGAVVTKDRRLFERALLYHDCGAPFWNYGGGDITEPLFTGTNMRVSEVTGAILRVQLGRLDGILADLRSIKRRILDAVADIPGLTPSPSNDIEGDCGVCLPFIFETEEKAIAFEKAVGGSRPINTGKHVYTAWSPVLERRAGPTDRLNPYNNPLNAACALRQDKDCALRTLDILSRTVYVMNNCNFTFSEVDTLIARIAAAAATANAIK